MRDASRQRRIEGLVFFAAFAACVPAANWMIGHVGTACIPDGPCVLPVAPGITAPSGGLLVGLALVLRDLVQRRLGIAWSLAAVGLGALLAATFAPPALVWASATAFLLSEVADLTVYTPLQRRGLILAVIASGMVGLVVDSVIFLFLAFGSLDYLAGQILGKLWMTLASLPVLLWMRSRDRRLGLLPDDGGDRRSSTLAPARRTASGR